jgi:ABC-type nitrate/sulfonate/bicarbonate transport system substrate-binding protein
MVKRSWLGAAGIAALSIAVVGLAGCSPTEPTTTPSEETGAPIELRIAMNASASSLPIVAADLEGFFEDEGITVTREPVPDVTLIPQLLGQQYDIGFTVAPIAISAFSGGLDVSIISGNNFNSPDVEAGQLITAKDITDVSQLEGATIAAITTTGSLNLATLAWLDSQGVSPDSVRVVQVAPPDMLPQLQEGVIQAMESNFPFTQLALDAGFNSLGDPENELYGRTVDSYWLASGSWAAANPDGIERFKRALDNADQWLADNPEDAAQMLSDFSGIPPATASLVPMNQFTTDFTSDDVQVWLDLMKDFGGFAPDVDLDKLVFQG